MLEHEVRLTERRVEGHVGVGKRPLGIVEEVGPVHPAESSPAELRRDGVEVARVAY